MDHPQAGLTALYERHREGLRRYLARKVGSAEAEDLLHDVFERARHAAPAAGAAWLFRAARNVALDRLRSRALREREDVARALGDAAHAPPAPPPDVDLSRARMRSCLLELVERLAPGQREVLLLTELGGLSDQETADTLGLTRGAAKIRLHRARRALRELVERECCTFRDERDVLVCEPR